MTVDSLFVRSFVCMETFGTFASIYYCIKRIWFNLILLALKHGVDNSNDEQYVLSLPYVGWQRQYASNGVFTHFLTAEPNKKWIEHFFSSLNLCFKTQFNDFFIKNKRLFSIERKKKNCLLDCVCRLTFYPVDGEKSTIYVYLIKRWDAPANGTCCQRVFGAHCARCSQHTQKTT